MLHFKNSIKYKRPYYVEMKHMQKSRLNHFRLHLPQDWLKPQSLVTLESRSCLVLAPCCDAWPASDEPSGGNRQNGQSGAESRGWSLNGCLYSLLIKEQWQGGRAEDTVRDMAGEWPGPRGPHLPQTKPPRSITGTENTLHCLALHLKMHAMLQQPSDAQPYSIYTHLENIHWCGF